MAPPKNPELSLASDTTTRGRLDDGAPSSRAPERVEGIGTAAYRMILPLLNDGQRERYRQLSELLDAAPEFAAALQHGWSAARAAQTTGAQAVLQQPQPQPQPRATILLSAMLAAVIVVIGVAMLMWVRDLNSRVEDVDAKVTAQLADVGDRFGDLEKAIAGEAGQRQAIAKQQELDQQRNDKQDERLASAEETLQLLTGLVISRLDALGERTGADKLESWKAVPPELDLVAALGRIGQGAKEQGSKARQR